MYIGLVVDVGFADAFRLIRLMKTFKSIKEVRIMADVGFQSVQAVGWLFIIFFCIMSIYSIVGVTLFGDTNPFYFGTYSEGMFTLLQVVTGDSWASNVARRIDEYHPTVSKLYFSSFIILGAIIIMNILQAVFLNNYISSEEAAIEQDEKLTLLNLFAAFDQDDSGTISIDEIREVCNEVNVDGVEQYEFNPELLFDAINDPNSNSESGEINFKEFYQAYIKTKHNSQHTNTMIRELQGEVSQLKKLIEQLLTKPQTGLPQTELVPPTEESETSGSNKLILLK